MEKEELTKVSVWVTGNGNDFWFTGGPPIGIPLAVESALREALNAREKRRQQEAALPKYMVIEADGYCAVRLVGTYDGGANFPWWAGRQPYANRAEVLEAAEAEKARLEARDRQRAGLPPKGVPEEFRDVG